jgi:hypothetical protein
MTSVLYTLGSCPDTASHKEMITREMDMARKCRIPTSSRPHQSWQAPLPVSAYKGGGFPNGCCKDRIGNETW